MPLVLRTWDGNFFFVLDTMSLFQPRGSKMLASYSQLHSLCEFDTLGINFEGEISTCYCLHLASNLDDVSSNSKAAFSVASV